MLLKTYKYRLYPNKDQEQLFNKTFGAVRFIYNQMLNNQVEIYEEHKNNKKKLRSIIPRTYTSFKHEFPWLKEVDNYALANAKINLDDAFRRFFKKQTGFPKFKTKKYNKQAYKTNNYKGSIRIEGDRIRFPKVGFVKFKQHRSFDGVIKSCTITKTKTNNYYALVLVEQKTNKKEPLKNKIGIDLGIAHFAITANDIGESEKYDNPEFLRKSEQELIKAQKALNRKKKGSKNRKKAKIKLAKKHEKVTNQRKDFLHKLSHKITSENQVIVIETLKSSNMLKNHKLSKSISDASWYEFARQLEYKSEWYGRKLIKANQWYASSQICSNCGVSGGKKPLNIREWQCDNCNMKHDRDINAANNLLSLAN